jgi:hypothetical protein
MSNWVGPGSRGLASSVSKANEVARESEKVGSRRDRWIVGLVGFAFIAFILWAIFIH